MPELLASFRGRVTCRRTDGPLGLALTGVSPEHPGESATLAFAARAPEQLPDSLEDVQVHDLGGSQYRIDSAAGQWLIAAHAVHLHRDVAREFYGAIPPRPVPPGKRLFWRLVLALAASRAGLSLLRTLRR